MPDYEYESSSWEKLFGVAAVVGVGIVLWRSFQAGPEERKVGAAGGAGFRTVDEMIGFADWLAQDVNAIPARMPGPSDLNQLFIGTRPELTNMGPSEFNYYRGLLYSVRDVMNREGYAHSRTGYYQISPTDHLVLVTGPDGGLRIDVDRSSY